MRNVACCAFLTLVALAALSLAQQQPAVERLPERANRWALVVGIDNYNPPFSALDTAVNDAAAIAAALIDNAGFSPGHVTLLISGPELPDALKKRGLRIGKPTRADILAELDSFAAMPSNEGLFLFAFSGHGLEESGEAYLLPEDARYREGGLELLKDTAIGMTLLHGYLSRTRRPQIMAILDACRNTPVLKSKGQGAAMGAPYRLNFDVQNREVKAFATFYATQSDSRSWPDPVRKMGFFTEALVDALEGLDKDAATDGDLITLESLKHYLEKTVPPPRKGSLGAAAEAGY